ncbi:unnamed protein product [Strongylus vulgaris]|uniref:Uncharacterized protein n=1 Tax=Strongylus vulgaris TaxID=40348 RepID=A0A3P7K9G6_STRVU|nr:unnamed protein product [Strongylus vulgaris]
MFGPVTLESLAPINLKLPDGVAVTPGHIVSFNGQTKEVPGEIYCHLCNNSMKLGLRKTKYKGETREYATYRYLWKFVSRGHSFITIDQFTVTFPAEEVFPGVFGRDVKRSAPFVKSSNRTVILVIHKSSMKANSAFVNEQSNGNENVTSVGTLLYVKQEVTEKQMEKMLEFDFKFFNKRPAPMHNIPRLLFGRLNMSLSELDEHLKTAQGQKEIQHRILRFRQPSPPCCVIEATGIWEAMIRQEQSRTSYTSCDA